MKHRLKNNQVSILFLINFYLTKISIEEFQEKVLLSSKNIETLFHTQQKVAEQTTEGIARESLSSKFKTDIYYLQNIFKTFLIKFLFNYFKYFQKKDLHMYDFQ